MRGDQRFISEVWRSGALAGKRIQPRSFLSTVTRAQVSCIKLGLAMNRHVTMPIAQNAPIGVGLLSPADSVGNNPMNVGVVVNGKGFVSRSKEENAATATLERAAAAEYLSSFEP